MSFETVYSFIITLAFLTLCFSTYKIYKKNKDLEDSLYEMSSSLLENQDTVQQQFLKFVSDSREWAFEYIENVQESIEDIIKFMKPVVINRDNKEYNDRDVLESVYKSLNKLLPEEGN